MTREEAIQALKKEKRTALHENKVAFDMAIQALEQEPKTGHWVRQTDDYHDYYECEHCGIAVGLDDIKNYCPNCGAEMENEVEE